jgi:CheY-like chemotaxis protein
VILDLMLGRDQTGWAVLELLRSDPALRSTPVILCSAAVPALQRNVDPAGVDMPLSTIAKPFDVDHLLVTINRLLTTSDRVSG